MSSLAVCALLTRVGYAPVMQISCRDKNRIAIQGDILGGAAMGVCNLLCLTGDGVQAGDHPQATPVFDLDSMSLLGNGTHAARRASFPQRPQDHLRAARAARARPRIRSRRRSNGAPRGSPRRSPPARSSSRPSTATTCRCSEASCDQVEDLGLLDKVFILVGVGTAALRQGGRVDAHPRAGRAHPGRGHRATARAPSDQRARGPQAVHRSDPGDPHHQGRARRAPHGLSPGGNAWPRSSTAPACSRAACPGTRGAIRKRLQTGWPHDRHRDQFRHAAKSSSASSAPSS